MKYGIGRSPRESNLIVLAVAVSIAIFAYLQLPSGPTSSISTAELNKEIQEMNAPPGN